MTYRDEINIEYFTWLFDLVCKETLPRQISYSTLIKHLHKLEFRYSIERDGNRAEDGLSMRYRFACSRPDLEDVELYLEGPCSILEMMIALAIRCEEFMDDPGIGDRTSQWFWGMITNLGLGSMTDDSFDREYVNYVIMRFLNREYDPDGRGGLFTVRNCDCDIRTKEIWIQLCWYLDTIS